MTPLKVNNYQLFLCLLFLGVLSNSYINAQNNALTGISLSPKSNAENINIDTRLVLNFNEKPILNNSGSIKVFHLKTNRLVDVLDLSIPPGPRNNRAPSPYDSLTYNSIPDKLYTVRDPDTSRAHVYQQTFIGGTSPADKYHFYPILIHGNTATINLHNNKLDYNSSYYVEIDKDIFLNDHFNGIKGNTTWVFHTKRKAPSQTSKTIVVASDGSGDFNTVQGALDFIPDKNNEHKTIYIKNGRYEEIVHFKNKKNLTIEGQDREQTIVCYANNGVFNDKKSNLDPKTNNEVHNIRSVFAANNSENITIQNMTFRSLGKKPAQAEAMLIKGDKIIVNNVNIEGSGDALQATGRIYISNTKIQGFGDNVLGYGTIFFNACDFVSTYGPHLWVRNTKDNHGNVLLNCTLRTIGDVETTIARAPDSNGRSYPFVEAVLIDCKLEGIRPVGWGKVHENTSGIRYWEYNSTSLEDSKPIDTSKRHPASRQLTMENDSDLISNYKNPAFVLEGWTPNLNDKN